MASFHNFMKTENLGITSLLYNEVLYVLMLSDQSYSMFDFLQNNNLDFKGLKNNLVDLAPV